MAFADYTDLRTAVVEQVGTNKFVDVFDRLTKFAELYFNRNLRMSAQLKEITLTFADGSADLPDDFAELYAVYDSSGRELNQQTLQEFERYLGQASGQYDVQYYAKIPTLTGAPTNTNWLLEGHPDVYLFSCAYEAARHMRDTELATAMKALRDDAIFEARSQDTRVRFARARVRIKGVTP